MTCDPVALTKALIRCPSVTPNEGGAITLLQDLLSKAGFVCTRTDRNGIANLYARWGTGTPVLGFNGHTDVVPIGDPAAWSDDPFGAVEREGRIWGRGAQDMKSGVAAFAAAAVDFVADSPDGSVVLTITGDEEGDSVDGTTAILDWMTANGERMDACIVGEPTSPSDMGEMIKIGRRGSMTAWITATGLQGHSAYPHKANNPVHGMVALLGELSAAPLDDGTPHFDPSTLQITGFDTGNAASNVIPATCHSMVNIRFNDAHTGAQLSDWLHSEAVAITDQTGIAFDLKIKISGESFLTPPGAFSDLVSNAVQNVTGRRPQASTTGGTSDARFIKDHCPVVEVGLVGDAMHQVDESVPVAQIMQLKEIYSHILKDYLG